MERNQLIDRIRLFGSHTNGMEEKLMYSLQGRETIYLQELRPGMVLAEPIIDRNGNRLLNSEVTLDESKIAKLRDRGIGSVRVKRETKLHRIARRTEHII